MQETNASPTSINKKNRLECTFVPCMQQLITEEIKVFVNTVKLGFVATVCPDGTPNLSPKGTTIAWDANHLAFADIHSPGTVSNLKENSSIEVNVVDMFTRKGYRFKGVGLVLSEGNVYEEILAYYRSTGSNHQINNIVLIEVHTVLPVISPAYFTSLSEKEITDRWIRYWQEIHRLE